MTNDGFFVLLSFLQCWNGQISLNLGLRACKERHVDEVSANAPYKTNHRVTKSLINFIYIANLSILYVLSADRNQN